MLVIELAASVPTALQTRSSITYPSLQPRKHDRSGTGDAWASPWGPKALRDVLARTCSSPEPGSVGETRLGQAARIPWFASLSCATCFPALCISLYAGGLQSISSFPESIYCNILWIWLVLLSCVVLGDNGWTPVALALTCLGRLWITLRCLCFVVLNALVFCLMERMMRAWRLQLSLLAAMWPSFSLKWSRSVLAFVKMFLFVCSSPAQSGSS